MGGDSKIRILVVENSYHVTGAFKSILQNAIELRDSFDFIFVIPKASVVGRYLKEKDFEYVSFSFVEIKRQLRNLLLYIPSLVLNALKMVKLCKRKRIDIIHSNDLYNLVPVCVKLFHRKVKVVTHVRILHHSFPLPLYKFWLKVHQQLSDHIVCVSTAVKDYFKDEKKAIVVFDRMCFKENYKKEFRESINDEVRLLYLGNYIRGKGQDYALKAFHKAFKLNPKIRLTFVGGDMGLGKNKLFKRELLEYVEQNELDKVVKFRDFEDNVERMMKSHHVALNFSESESFSLTCLEALYYGTPLIATDSGGPKDLFENGRSGILVPNKNIEAMADAINHLASDENLRNEFSIQAKKFVEQKFDSDKINAQMKNIYIELIK